MTPNPTGMMKTHVVVVPYLFASSAERPLATFTYLDTDLIESKLVTESFPSGYVQIMRLVEF